VYHFSAKDFWEYSRNNINLSYRGILNAKDFFGGLIDELRIEGVAPEDMAADWVRIRDKTSRINEDVFESVEKLRENYLVGVLSNSTFLNEKVSVRKRSYEPFEFKILSCDVGFCKPDVEIYEVLVDELKGRGVGVDEVVFVDDREENLVPARDLGMKGILFESGEQMIRDLKKLGISF